jgi:hypothetical protein
MTMEAEVKVEGVGVVEAAPVIEYIPVELTNERVPMSDDGIPILETSHKAGFDPRGVADPRTDNPDNEGGIIAPVKRKRDVEGAVMLTGFKASYFVGNDQTSQDIRQDFDSIDDAKASIINSKSCYAVTSRGLKLAQIVSGAPRISVGDKEAWI